eukprot:scaffold56736_cov32-Prasinocladus_malaysianus.AAC.1
MSGRPDPGRTSKVFKSPAYSLEIIPTNNSRNVFVGSCCIISVEDTVYRSAIIIVHVRTLRTKDQNNIVQLYEYLYAWLAGDGDSDNRGRGSAEKIASFCAARLELH